MNDLCTCCGCEMNEHDTLDGRDTCDDCVITRVTLAKSPVPKQDSVQYIECEHET